MGKFKTRHQERDLALPMYRQQLLDSVVSDLTNDSDVLAVYLGGSLAKGNFDVYSDIDLRIVVKSEKHREFVAEKLSRPKRWGDILFFEDLGPNFSHTVAHFDCFVKVDTFYYKPEELQPSLWLQDSKILYDPHNIVKKIYEDSLKITYSPSVDEYERWRGKVFAYMHEAYRRVMREEMSYALKQITGLSWFIVQGWHMEKGRFPNLWADWSKVEGPRSCLEEWQLSLLDSWHCERDQTEIMKTMASMIPEFLRLNKVLSKMLQVEEKNELWEKVIELVL
jgi:predicted nucleotidyltransferase